MTVKEEYIGISYEIRKRRQAKRMSLKVSHDGRVWVSVPMRVSLHDARTFFRTNIAFVQKALDNIAAERSQRLALPSSSEKTHVIVEGEWLPLSVEAGECFAITFSLTTVRHIVVTVPQEKMLSEAMSRAAALEYWRYCMITRANEVLPKRTLELAQSFGETVRRIAVKNQKSVWGSCVKARRSLNLNWRCILFPPSVRDYLIIHELAHLRQANHSDAYWEQVEQWCPDYREAERWLKANGKRVMSVSV
ncbi:MAG: M48 family metallopeptidase [Candidatus Kapabacteria bacterium]|jgi:hypothetical protein|nr:M48 family metallopeptidase [Candidatus Kapabacteria bacterium]